MGRGGVPKDQRRVRVPINILPDILAWVDEHVGPGKWFYNRTHAFEFAMARFIEESQQAPEGQKKKPAADDDAPAAGSADRRRK